MSHTRTALVTGASAGIGAATTRALVAAGYHVFAAARRLDRLEALHAELGAAVTPVQLDVTDPLSIANLAEVPGALEVDVLVNNAGLAKGTDPMQSADPDDWDTMLDTNVKGLLRVTRAVLGHMTTAGGDIVNLGSVAGRWTYPGGGVYCASKHAVRAISEGLRLDLQGKNVRVINIEPGLVETEFSEVRFSGDKERAAAVYANTRALRAEDVAETIAWCLSRPAHINVQELVLYPTDQASVRDVVRHNS